MRLLADLCIPDIDTLFADHFDITRLPATQITPKSIADHDILIVRSITPVNKDLLSNSAIQFVGTVTSGFDHLDTEYLDAQQIAWCNAPGANAQAVADYVLAILARLQIDGHLPTESLKVTIVGVGQVGQKVQAYFSALGYSLTLCDPPRADNEADFKHTAFEAIKDQNLICFHVPNVINGLYPTFHLIDETFLKKQRPSTVLINVARGDVLDEHAMLKSGSHCHLCLDVFPNEPNLNPALIKQCLIATPHIAGHSVEAKARAVQMIFEAIMQHLGRTSDLAQSPQASVPAACLSQPGWQNQILSQYDPMEDDTKLRAIFTGQSDIPKGFQRIRDHYGGRHELK